MLYPQRITNKTGLIIFDSVAMFFDSAKQWLYTVSVSTLIIRNTSLLVTMDDQRNEIINGGMIIRNGFIETVSPTSELPPVDGHEIDLDGHIVLPGLVNTHHHLYQTLTRAVPAAQSSDLFQWLQTLYPIWARLTPDAVYTSALVGTAELLLSGCTTTSDHLYLFPNGSRLDDTIRAADEIGIRFHAARGSMSLGESDGGLPPDSVVETESEILADSQRLLETYHNPKRGSMLRIVIAPCSPFSVSPNLMRESLELGRSYGAQMHTHLAETRDEEAYCLDMFGHRPVHYAEELGWTGTDTWFAHVVNVNSQDIQALSRNKSGVAHCPSSNMRLASGIAPIQKFIKNGVTVGLAVDGSASNDSSHLLAEARQAMLLSRINQSPGFANKPDHKMMGARESLEIATLGGAAVLQRDDIGALSPGKCADFFALDLNRLDYAGALHDPVAATIFCSPQKADLVVVNGKVVVQNGQITNVDLDPVIRRQNKLALQMIDP